MKVTETKLPGVLLVEPQVFGDDRGFFLETYRHERYAEHGIDVRFVQDSLSRSRKGVLRGFHLQWPKAQAKLVYVLEGEVFDVAVDVRRDSPTFGQWTGHMLSAENKHQLYIPEGFAHGFQVTSETALFAYKCSHAYAPDCEIAVAWNDPEIGVEWPLEPTLSAKDEAALKLRDVRPLPHD